MNERCSSRVKGIIVVRNEYIVRWMHMIWVYWMYRERRERRAARWSVAAAARRGSPCARACGRAPRAWHWAPRVRASVGSRAAAARIRWSRAPRLCNAPSVLYCIRVKCRLHFMIEYYIITCFVLDCACRVFRAVGRWRASPQVPSTQIQNNICE